jgi:hypothetical protein
MSDVAVVTNKVPSSSPDASTKLGAALATGGNIETHSGTGGAGAIGIFGGSVFITDTGAALLTLVQPVAGAPSAGGNDGQRLTIICTTAHAHTVTTALLGIKGSLHIITFANVGDSIELDAFNGVWYVVGTPTAVVS